MLSAIRGYPIKYPVAFDWEFIDGAEARTNGMDGDTVTQCATAFCDLISVAGYTPIVYFNQELGYLFYQLDQLDASQFWLAEYDTKPDFFYDFEMWQYTHTGSGARDPGKCGSEPGLPEDVREAAQQRCGGRLEQASAVLPLSPGREVPPRCGPPSPAPGQSPHRGCTGLQPVVHGLGLSQGLHGLSREGGGDLPGETEPGPAPAQQFPVHHGVQPQPPAGPPREGAGGGGGEKGQTHLWDQQVGEPVRGHGIRAGHHVIPPHDAAGQQVGEQQMGQAIAVGQLIDPGALGAGRLEQGDEPLVGDGVQKPLLYPAGGGGALGLQLPGEDPVGPAASFSSRAGVASMARTSVWISAAASRQR